MKVHELKTWPEPFDAVTSGSKVHEVRVNDRDFQDGDTLCLRKYDPVKQVFTGEYILATVGHVTRGPDWGLPDGLCVMSLLRVGTLGRGMVEVAHGE